MAQDILVVDDIKSALENFGNEIRLNLGIEPFLADDPQQALDILRDYPVKVLVTDQDMPSMTGTELVRKAKQLGLKIPCIMLTGYTDKVSVGDAVNLGFFRFIDKVNAHAELIQAIRQAIQRYEIEQTASFAALINKPLAIDKKFVRFNTSVATNLIRISSIVNPFVREQDWQTMYVGQRGVKGIQEITYTSKVTSSCEYGFNAELLHKAGFKLSNLIAALENSLEGKVALSLKGKYEEELCIQAKYTLEVKEIADKQTPEGLLLHSREYQTAPVFTRVNSVVEVMCNCCQIPKTYDLSIDLPTQRIALRQIEHYDKGQTKKVYTGFVAATVQVATQTK